MNFIFTYESCYYMTLLSIHDCWNSTYLSLQWLHHHNFHIIMWWRCDMSLSLITRTNSVWWHALSSMVTWLPLIYLFFMELLIIDFLSLQSVIDPLESSGYFHHQDFNVSFVIQCFFSFSSSPNILHAFFPCCSKNTCIYNHSWQAYISQKISYSKLFHVDFSIRFYVHALTMFLKTKRRASRWNDTFQNAKGLSGRGFKASRCIHALKRKRHSREGAGCMHKGRKRSLKAPQVHYVLKGDSEGVRYTHECSRMDICAFTVFSCPQETNEGTWYTSKGWRMNLCAFRVHSGAQMVKREHGTLWQVEGWNLRDLGCTHAPRKGTLFKIEGVHSKE